ncbi:Uma2 family endonuclease [Candidatus Poribacteria bacterium]|nr:Uma2 family endonuclease [Candidatus Poribacteria bacterium]
MLLMGKQISRKIRSLPAERTIIYPESDGKPMAETDIHRDLMVDMIDILKNHFTDIPDVYVSGNLLLYYEPGNPRKHVAPDVFAVFGVEKKRRRTYLLWEEGKGPDVVLELVSRKTYRKDLGEKKELYASVFSVKEYYLYDPDGRYLQPTLQGYRLAHGVYFPIQRTLEDRLPSFVLGLELGETDIGLGLYNPQTNQWLLKPVEEEASARRQAEEKAQREFQARQQEAEARRQAEARAQQAEAELARLRTELERLRNPSKI